MNRRNFFSWLFVIGMGIWVCFFSKKEQELYISTAAYFQEAVLIGMIKKVCGFLVIPYFLILIAVLKNKRISIVKNVICSAILFAIVYYFTYFYLRIPAEQVDFFRFLAVGFIAIFMIGDRLLLYILLITLPFIRETLHNYFPGIRSGTSGDIVANIIAILIGIFLAAAMVMDIITKGKNTIINFLDKIKNR